jgi:dipeptidyl aminopeptidase/acylaminoacyl peptidase
LLTAIGITVLLLAFSVSYFLVRDGDVYKYHTGLGSRLALSADDQRLAFSYYKNGSEAIYSTDMDTMKSEQITFPKEGRHRQPAYSRDGRKILYLSENKDRIQSLFVANNNGSAPKKLSGDDLHVADALFSADGQQVFFAAIEGKEFLKTEGETKEGLDLYSVGIDGRGLEQLTDSDHFTMDSLSLSRDGTEIYFKDFTDVYVYNIEEGRKRGSELTSQMPAEPFYLTFSPDGDKAAYTAVSPESENSSLFEYELYVRNLKNGESTRLTHLKSSVVSPVFYHNEDKIVFFHYRNWPGSPEEYRVHTVALDGGDVEELSLALPKAESSTSPVKLLDAAVNGVTIGGLYILLLVLAILYFRPAKTFRPVLISLALGILGFVASFVVAATGDPWGGIAVGMISAFILGFTAIAFLFALALKMFVK